MRLRRVFGCRPKIAAAPCAPSTLPPATCNTFWMCIRCTSSSVSPAGAVSCTTSAGRAAPDAPISTSSTGTLRQDRSSLEHVLKLAHVARPAVTHHPLHALVAAALKRFTQPARKAREKEADELREIRRAIAKRWNLDRKHIQSIQQVRTQRPFGDCLFEASVGRRDDPHVDSDGSATADRLVFHVPAAHAAT